MMNAASAVVITPHVKTALVYQMVTLNLMIVVYVMVVMQMILAVAVLSRDPLVVIIPVVLL